MYSSFKLASLIVRLELHKRFPERVDPPSFEAIKSGLCSPGMPFEIEEVELKGHLMRCWKNAAPSMAAVVESSLAYGDDEFIVYGHERLTYREHYRRVASVAQQLIERFGLVKGERVAIAMRNYPEWSIAFWAAAVSGAVVVPLNAWWKAEELEYALTDSGARVIFVDDERAACLREIASDLPVEHVVGVRCESLPADVTAIEDLWKSAPETLSLPSVTLCPEDNATLFYTSGTTGFPKGTLGTHRNFCSAALTMPFSGVQGMLRSGRTLFDLMKMKSSPRAALLTVPLFHVTGCHGLMLGILGNGGKLVMLHKWDPSAALETIEQEDITIFTGVPSMVRQLLDVNEIENHDLSGITNIGYGGAPAPPDLLRRIRRAMPAVGASNGWGITEASAGIATNSGQDYIERPDSVGIASPVYDVKVVDASGKMLAANELGELWVRGPGVVKGYWGKQAATEASFTDGWFHTGDVGRIDGEGFIYLVDRLKDMIIRGGENIYCAEVEGALSEHPAVIQPCVFGLADEVLGEQVAAVVQVGPSTDVREEELIGFVADRMAAYKVPEKIWMRVEPLPTGATGKILKKEVRESYAEQERQVACG